MTLPSTEDDWVFDEPKNVISVTTRQVMQEGSPILLVAHDAEDGSWQFLTGSIFSVADGMLVTLHTIVKHDPTVCELADLPLGWEAHRDSVGSPWRRSRNED
jgi:hypothetical protein